jgi:myo-inositol-1-phosphate synthase
MLVRFKLLNEDPGYNNNNNNNGKEMQFQNDLRNKTASPTEVLQKITNSNQQRNSHISGTSLFEYQGNSRIAIRH